MYFSGNGLVGSPPHTWRILAQFMHFRPLDGITSTYVENTLHFLESQERKKDHLHIRGEYLLVCWWKKTVKGSPPHTWRIPDAIKAGTIEAGITSTYVENTRQDRRKAQ